MLRIVLPFLFVSAVVGTYGGGYANYGSQDCGGSCGGGCGGSGAYTNPCGGNSAPVVQYESSGCDSGDCGGGSGGGHSSRYSSGRSSSSGYHKTVTTVTKETSNNQLKIVLGAPTVHRTTYVQPAPQPVIYKQKQRYVDEGEGDYAASGSGCAGGCDGGGSRIVKIIKKTTYGSSGGGGGVCNTCESEGSYSSGNYEQSYSEPVEQPTIVTRKVTRIISQPKIVTRVVTQPKIVRVIKTSVVADQPSGEYYEDSSSSGSNYGGGHGGQRQYSGGYSGGGGRAKAKAFAFASASASAGAGAGSGDYSSGGGGGCKSGCDEWKK